MRDGRAVGEERIVLVEELCSKRTSVKSKHLISHLTLLKSCDQSSIVKAMIAVRSRALSIGRGQESEKPQEMICASNDTNWKLIGWSKVII